MTRIDYYNAARNISMIDETGKKKHSFLIVHDDKTYSFRDVQIIFKNLCDTIDDLHIAHMNFKKRLSGINEWVCKAEKLFTTMKDGIDKIVRSDKTRSA